MPINYELTLLIDYLRYFFLVTLSQQENHSFLKKRQMIADFKTQEEILTVE